MGRSDILYIFATHYLLYEGLFTSATVPRAGSTSSGHKSWPKDGIIPISAREGGRRGPVARHAVKLKYLPGLKCRTRDYKLGADRVLLQTAGRFVIRL